MSAPLSRLLAAAIAALVLAVLGPAAQGQAIPANVLPEQRTFIDERGVDLVSLSFRPAQTVVSIGPEQGGLAEVFRFNSSTGRFRGRIDVKPHGPLGLPQKVAYQVTIDDATKTFESPTQGYPYVATNFDLTDDEQTGTRLTRVGNVITFMAADGSVAVFDSNYAPDQAAWGPSKLGGLIALLTTMTTPEGYKTDIHLKAAPHPAGGSQQLVRVQSVTTNSGYQLKYTYLDNDPSNPTNWNWAYLVQAINNANEYCSPTADSCTLSGAWPMGGFAPLSATTTLVTDAASRTTAYAIDPSAGVEMITLPTGASATLTTGSGGTRTWTNGVETFVYTAFQLDIAPFDIVVQISGPLSYARQTTFSYPDSRIVADVDALGRQTDYAYDPSGRLIAEIFDGVTTSYTHDSRGNVLTTTVTPKAGSGLSALTSKAGFALSCTPTTLPSCNKPLWTSAPGDDPENPHFVRTDYTYDAGSGQLLTVTRPAPAPTAVRPQVRFTYASLQAYYLNSSGVIVANPQAISKLVSTSACATLATCGGTNDETLTTITYGAAGVANNLLPLTVTSGSGNPAGVRATVTTGYDTIGNVFWVDGPLAGIADVTVYHHNTMREVAGFAGPDPDGAGALKYRAVLYSYRSDGQPYQIDVGTVTNPLAWANFTPLQSTLIAYDAVGRPVRSSLAAFGAAHQITQTSYDAVGRPECVAVRMNPAEFNSLPSSACTLDTAGMFGPDRITRTTYNAAGQVIDVTRAYGTPLALPEARYTYNTAALPATVKDANGNLTTYEYDGFNRPAKTVYPSKTVTGTSDPADYEQYRYKADDGLVDGFRRRNGTLIEFGYDILNREIYRTFPATHTTYDNFDRVIASAFASPSTHALTWVYDPLGRVTARGDSFGTTSFGYDLAGRRTSVTWPDGFAAAYGYDVTGGMTAVWAYDPVSGSSMEIGSFAYDDLGRRITAYRGLATANTRTDYAYDAASNLSTLVNKLASPLHDVTKSFAYNPAGQIVSQSVSNPLFVWSGYTPNWSITHNGLNQVTAAGGTPYAFDSNGNQTGDGTVSRVFDAVNRLVSSAAGGTTTALSYDPAGRLYDYAISPPLRFQYDGGEIMAEYDTSGVLQRRYIKGASPDETLAWFEGTGLSQAYFLYTDERGSTISIATQSGAPSFPVLTYDEYGQPGAGNVGRFGYTGQAWLYELGLNYYKARMYSRWPGTFLQPDPIGYAGGMNLYGYVGGDPINATDPNGLNRFVAAKEWRARRADDEVQFFNIVEEFVIVDGEERVLSREVTRISASQAYDRYMRSAAGTVAGITSFYNGVKMHISEDGASCMCSGKPDQLGVESGSSRVHGNSHASKRPQTLYYLIHQRTGEIWKIGITQNPATRYVQALLKAFQLDMVVVSSYPDRITAVVAEGFELAAFYVDHQRLPYLNYFLR